jgi:hypothetical protein
MALATETRHYSRKRTFFAAHGIPFPEQPTFSSSTEQLLPTFKRLDARYDGSRATLIENRPY